jgi:hypothetical protein
MQNSRTQKIILWILSAFIIVIFVQSLFFKFTDSPETQYIFGTLDKWGASLGFPGLFAHKGIFSQYVVGTAELIASSLLLLGLITQKPLIHAFAALLSLGVISGAIFFHLFTPLGVQVLNADGTYDGGELFSLACGVWLCSAVILFLRKDVVMHAVR